MSIPPSATGGGELPVKGSAGDDVMIDDNDKSRSKDNDDQGNIAAALSAANDLEGRKRKAPSSASNYDARIVQQIMEEMEGVPWYPPNFNRPTESAPRPSDRAFADYSFEAKLKEYDLHNDAVHEAEIKDHLLRKATLVTIILESYMLHQPRSVYIFSNMFKHSIDEHRKNQEAAREKAAREGQEAEQEAARKGEVMDQEAESGNKQSNQKTTGILF